MHGFSVLLSGKDNSWWQNLTIAFEQNPAFQVFGTSAPEHTLRLAREIQPDIVVWCPETHGTQLPVRDLKVSCPGLIPVALVKDHHHLDLLPLIRDGLCGCLPLRLTARQIVNAIDVMVVGGLLCLPKKEAPTGFLSTEYFRHGRPIDFKLTDRENEVLLQLVQAQSNLEIARRLCLSESTVKTHLRNIFKKMGVRSRSEALLHLYRS